MLEGRIVRKVMMAGIVLCGISMTAITGCKWPKPEMDYMGKYDQNGNCIKYGSECAVIKVNAAGGYTVHEYVVDLR
ncbi:MAG: hypothetical protein KAW46_06895 [candidate division Zixibacteria bacterium]|nr:hypothetical protein [candidate division Zixibacteria bacterium]